MSELFITKIRINEVRHLKDFEIPLSETERKHLILTGRNGSGKTSVLEAMDKVLRNQEPWYDVGSGHEVVRKAQISISMSGGLANYFEQYESGDFIYLYLPAKRSPKFEVPLGPQKIELGQAKYPKKNLGELFIQFLVNIWVEKSLARDDKDTQTISEIEDWFENFRKELSFLIGTDDVALEFDRKEYNFNILEKGKLPYSLNELSDGYASILSIFGELVLRNQGKGRRIHDYEVEGIVLIDEIETHLHIDLQKKVFPFLTKLFPKIQFIVTTHSPFVLSSVDNAVICDLEKRIVTEDLSAYSSELIVESYFDQDKYSDILKSQVAEYEQLMGNEHRTLEQEDRLLELERYLEAVPKYLSNELAAKLYEIQLKYFKPAP